MSLLNKTKEHEINGSYDERTGQVYQIKNVANGESIDGLFYTEDFALDTMATYADIFGIPEGELEVRK